jgi:hypothetical protein
MTFAEQFEFSYPFSVKRAFSPGCESTFRFSNLEAAVEWAEFISRRTSQCYSVCEKGKVVREVLTDEVAS